MTTKTTLDSGRKAKEQLTGEICVAREEVCVDAQVLMAIDELEAKSEVCIERPIGVLSGVRPRCLLTETAAGDARVDLENGCLVAKCRKMIHEPQASPKFAQKTCEANVTERKTTHSEKQAVAALSLEKPRAIRSICPDKILKSRFGLAEQDGGVANGKLTLEDFGDPDLLRPVEKDDAEAPNIGQRARAMAS